MRSITFVFLAFFLMTGLYAENPQSPGNRRKTAKNIILLIGDGMGTSAMYAGYTRNLGFLHMERFSEVGFSRTRSTSFVTDSGAGGTALATGHKTNNGAIGVDASGNPVKTILEWAEDHGKATGLVSTSAVTHATPASFVAHQAKRSDYELIALDFLKTDIDVFIGGGRNHFNKRKDGVDLVGALAGKGYQVAFDTVALKSFSKPPVAGLMDSVHEPRWMDGRGNLLLTSVREALRLLSQDRDGFFLMVEGSMIDWGAHDNDIEYVATEVVDFDRAVGAALDFAEADGNTLVIVTADHETGGVGINGGDLSSGTIKAGFTTKDHTGVFVPVLAYGPGSGQFKGFQENTDIFHKMMSAFGFKDKK